jgi:hypothetical protein
MKAELAADEKRAGMFYPSPLRVGGGLEWPKAATPSDGTTSLIPEKGNGIG